MPPVAAPPALTITITDDNATVFAAFHAELLAHLAELAEMTEKYPVEVQFKGLRYVFNSEDHIKQTISLIDEMLKNHRAARA